MATTLNDSMIAALPIPTKPQRIHYFAGYRVERSQAPMGFAVRVTRAGTRSFLLCYKDATGEHRATLGQFPAMHVAEAVRKASDLRQMLDGGADMPPAKIVKAAADREAHREAETAGVTVNQVLDDWTELHGQNLRSFHHRDGAFRRYVRPAIGGEPIRELPKSRIATMHAHIRRTAGRAMADQTLAYLEAVQNWFATRDDDYRPPVLRGLKSKPVARDRILSPDEIRAIWAALDGLGDFGAIVRLLLLTGQRLREIADARWSEIDLDAATLAIPAARYKTGIGQIVPLSAPALGILRAIPRRPGSDRLFSTMAFDKAKRRLDALAPLGSHWTLHDLRRTGRSLLARAGIRPDIAERVLGHVQGGVGGIYDRYDYLAEKRHALDLLAAEIGRITGDTPAGGNVVALRA